MALSPTSVNQLWAAAPAQELEALKPFLNSPGSSVLTNFSGANMPALSGQMFSVLDLAAIKLAYGLGSLSEALNSIYQAKQNNTTLDAFMRYQGKTLDQSKLPTGFDTATSFVGNYDWGTSAPNIPTTQQQQAATSTTPSGTPAGAPIGYDQKTGSPIYAEYPSYMNTAGTTPPPTTYAPNPTATPQPVTTGTPTAPQGPTPTPTAPSVPFPTTALQPGMSGPEVLKLQNYLVSLGLMSQADLNTGPGIYGPKTTAAVSALQQKLGVDNSSGPGYYGPLTLAAVQKTGGTAPTQYAGGLPPDDPRNQFNTATGQPNTNYNPNYVPGTTPTQSPVPPAPPQGPAGNLPSSYPTYNTGDPAQDQLLNQLSSYVQTMVNQGYKVNPNITIDDATINKFLDQAKKELGPYYAQQVDAVKGELGRNVSSEAKDYQRNIQDLDTSFQQNLGSARENFASAGTAFSGQRGLGETNMLNQQNRSYAALADQTARNLGTYARGAEEKLGSAGVSGFNLPELSRYSASLGGRGQMVASGGLNEYTPGTYKLGTIEQNQNQATQTYKNQLLSEEYMRRSNAPSYQNLFG